MGPELVVILYFAAGVAGVGGTSALLWRRRKKKQKLKEVKEHRRTEIDRHASRAETALADCQDAENDLRYLKLDVGDAISEAQTLLEDWRECIDDWRRNVESQRAIAAGGLWPDLLSLDEYRNRSMDCEVRLREKISEIRERPRRAQESVSIAEEDLLQVREKLRNLDCREAQLIADESSAAVEQAKGAIGANRYRRAIDLAERSLALSGKASRLTDNELSLQRRVRSAEELLMTKADRLERIRLSIDGLPKLRGLDDLVRETETCLKQARESVKLHQPKRAQAAAKRSTYLMREIEKRIQRHQEFLAQKEAQQRPFGPDVSLELQQEYLQVKEMVSSAVTKNRGNCPMCGRKGSHRCTDKKVYLMNATDGKRLYVRPIGEAKRLMRNPATAELARPILERLRNRAALDLQRGPKEPVDVVLATADTSEN